MKRKILSLFITALMIVTIMPGNVFAGTETAQQLYWFYNGDFASVGNDGKITVDIEEHYEMEKIQAEKAKDAIYGYFAYKSGDDYYAVNSAAITDNTNTGGYKLKLYTDDEEDGYEYCLSWTQRGSCSIQATVGETVYEIDAEFKLPYIGAYSSEAVSEAAYLDGEFHFADSQKDEAGNAYFYLIQMTEEYGSESLNAAVGSYTGSGWKTEPVDGIEFGKVEQKTLSGSKYYVSKVTVTKEFRNDRNNGYYYQIGFFGSGSDGENIIGIHSMQIYDSLEYPTEQQMYWVDYGYDIDENGLMNLIEDMPYYDSLDDLAVRVENRSYRSGNMGGCFAVKKDGNYYAVKAESVQHDNNICIEKDDEYVCLVRWTEFGTYTFEYSDGEKEYKFNLVVDLPDTGFYSKSERTEAGYIQSELHYIDAIGENDSDAYFYLITPSYGYDINTFSASIDEMTDDYRWIENTATGISVGQPRYLDESNEYCVWLVTVSKDYRGKTTDWEDKAYNRLQFCITSRVGDEEIYSNAIIDMNVYDSMEVNKDQMMYWFDSECVTINGDKRIVVNDKENYADWCAEEKMFTSDRTYGATYKCGEREGYFAVKIASGEYYAVDNVTVTGGENIKLTSDGNCKYTVTWSDSGDYQFAAEYKGKTYKQNLILHLPNTGFFSSEDISEDTYLNGEFHFITADNKSADGNEAYFYLIGNSDYYDCFPAFIGEDDNLQQLDGISFTKIGEKQIWKVTVTSDYRSGYYTARQIGWFDEDNELYGDTFDINIYDSTEVPEEQQLYWFYWDDVDMNEDGVLEADEESSVDECAEKILDTDQKNTYGYFAIKKGDQYYAVDSVQADGFTVKKGEAKGSYIVSRSSIGECYCSAAGGADDKEYRMKVIFVLPDYGFYSSISKRNSDTFLEYFDYSASENKTFYYISHAENFDSVGTRNISTKILSTDSEQEVSGISMKQCGSTKTGSNTYYYWKFEVKDSYSFNKKIQLVFSWDTNGNATSETFKVLGSVECGDVDTNGSVDYADALWLKRHIAGWSGYSDVYMKSADVNGDSKITEADVMILERYLAGWENFTNLPYSSAS